MKLSLRHHFEIELEAAHLNKCNRLPNEAWEKLCARLLAAFSRLYIRMGGPDPRDRKRDESRYTKLMWYRYRELSEVTRRLSPTKADRLAQEAHTYFMAYHQLRREADQLPEGEEKAIAQIAARECLATSKEKYEQAAILVPIEKGMVDKLIQKALQSNDE